MGRRGQHGSGQRWSSVAADAGMVRRVVVRVAVVPAAGMGTRFLPATKAVPKELLPIGDTPMLQLIIDEALGAGIDHVVVVSSKAKPGIEAYFDQSPEVIEALEAQGRFEIAERVRSIGSDWRATVVHQDRPRGLGHAVGCAREAVGDQPFAVLLPDELMGSSSLLAHMNGVCLSSGGSVVALKQVPRGGGRCVRRHRPALAGRRRRRRGHQGDGREARPRRCAERPDHHRTLRADPGRVRRDRAAGAGPRRGDPAHRRIACASGALAVPRGAERRRSLRHRHAARLPPGGGGAVAARRRVRRRPGNVPARAAGTDAAPTPRRARRAGNGRARRAPARARRR